MQADLSRMNETITTLTTKVDDFKNHLDAGNSNPLDAEVHAQNIFHASRAAVSELKALEIDRAQGLYEVAKDASNQHTRALALLTSLSNQTELTGQYAKGIQDNDKILKNVMVRYRPVETKAISAS